ncbi:GntR family transcriptional regulator [Aquamicrobium lusatiense]|uniref:FadR/GntR family transcriptional regulator n=1 Tax=Aquamicrobium lusatiense TaxID=89772 RepID=UPI0024564377|nr:GntR family transcriptional regulator [Aquamicrobium lusatiense]MDH4989588.1 GntR family transcriptional regulator [Aquamicrobium lusatiense]
MTTIERNPGLARQIADSLQDDILQNRLTVSERLPSEAELAERFRVSQPTVREAMKILAAKKLIRSKRGPKGGVFVNTPSLDMAAQTLHETTNWLVSLGVIQLPDIVETRRKLGRMAIEIACESATREDHKRIENALLELDHTNISDEDFCRLEVAFHQAVAEASRNAVLRLMMVVVNQSLIPAANMISFQFRQRDKVIAYQRQIFSAILNRDAAEAIAAFDALIDYQSSVYDMAVQRREEKQSAAAAGSLAGT